MLMCVRESVFMCVCWCPMCVCERRKKGQKLYDRKDFPFHYFTTVFSSLETIMLLIRL